MSIGEEFWLEGPLSVLIDGLSERNLAIDVGANEGVWSSHLSKHFDHVVAIEPDPRAAGKIPELPNVDVHACAVSDEDRDGILYVRHSTGQNSLLKVHPIGGGGMCPAPVKEELQVICRTLESLLPDGADFVKIDIEGGEVAALAGCTTPETWRRTAFVVECHDTFDEVLEQLRRLGKDVTKVPHPLAGAHPGHCWAIAK